MENQTVTQLATETSFIPNVSTSEALPKKVIDENGNVNISALTQEQKEKYRSLSRHLSVTDINSISSYGSDLQNAMNKYSNDLLRAVRAPQTGEIGALITHLLGELNYINVDELKEPSVWKKIIQHIPVLNLLSTNLTQILKKYDTIAKNVDDISRKIEATRLVSLRDNNTLQVMFDNNIIYGKQLEDLIIAAKLKLEEAKANLAAKTSGEIQCEQHEIQDIQMFINNLERRISDMMTMRYVVKQSLYQIRTVQYNNIALADKAQTIISTTIPLWKNQLSIAVALRNQKNNMIAQRKVTETTNAILTKNAELLHQNSIEIARENEKGIISIETLRNTTQNLINTVKEVKQIHDEASAKRKAAEHEILRLEAELETPSPTMTEHSIYPPFALNK